MIKAAVEDAKDKLKVKYDAASALVVKCGYTVEGLWSYGVHRLDWCSKGLTAADAPALTNVLKSKALARVDDAFDCTENHLGDEVPRTRRCRHLRLRLRPTWHAAAQVAVPRQQRDRRRWRAEGPRAPKWLRRRGLPRAGEARPWRQRDCMATPASFERAPSLNCSDQRTSRRRRLSTRRPPRPPLPALKHLSTSAQ